MPPIDRRTEASLRVALLSPCFWPEVRRGGERLVRELADGLIARGHRPRLITSHPGAGTRVVEDGLPITRHRRLPDHWLPENHEDYVTHIPLSFLDLLRGDDEIAHAVWAPDALAATAWGRLRRRPAVYTHLGIPDRSDLAERRWRRAIVERVLRGCAAFTVVSRAAAGAARETLGVEATVIYPGVDLARFRPGRERFAKPTVICPAAIEQPRKRVGMLVEAFREVRRQVPEARLLLSRPQGPAGAALRGEPGIDLFDDIADLPTLYARSWVCALPAFDEAFGLVLAEALACGTPVVGSHHGGIPEIVDSPAVGRIFQSDDAAGLAASLLETMDLAIDPNSAKACRTRAKEFSRERSSAAYERLYLELVA
jgi:glycosyltransferase involved in cell wall biosynthesis